MERLQLENVHFGKSAIGGNQEHQARPRGEGNLTNFEKSWMLGTARFLREFRRQDLTAEWVRRSLDNLVRLNNSGSTLEQNQAIYFRELPKETRNDFDLSSLETNYIRPRQNNIYEDDSENILQILLDPHFRRGNKERVLQHGKFLREEINNRTVKANPVEIVLPTLAFKDQNPLNTNHTIAHLDLGEYLLMAQMRDLAKSIEVSNVYPPGIHIIIISDGVVYVDMFANGDVAGAEEYRRNCWQIKEELGLRDTVEIIDMSWLVKREPAFQETRRKIKDILITLEKQDAQTKEKMEILTQGMFWNLPFPGYNFEEVAAFSSLPVDLLPGDLREHMHMAALDYASFLLTMSYLDIIYRAFPDALRATVHPKDAAQIPLHLVNRNSSVFPYNGVPVVYQKSLDNGKSLRESTRILRYIEVLQLPNVQAVYLPNETEPFYYLVN